MTDRLAGLVLPDSTPIDEAAPPPAQARARRWPRKNAAPAKAQGRPPRKNAKRTSSMSAGDVAIVGAGLALAFVCAIFPWYIFFNQDEFGTRAISFGERTSPLPPADAAMTGAATLAGTRMALPQDAFPQIDMEATGTVGRKTGRAIPASQQPFPQPKPAYKLVLVANGRGMIADKDGYWVVEPGSWLPDGSRVKALEKREDHWVLVTSNEAVVPLIE